MLTVDEVTDILRIGKNAAYDLFRTGKIKTLRVKRRWMIPKKALIEYVETESKLRWKKYRLQKKLLPMTGDAG